MDKFFLATSTLLLVFNLVMADNYKDKPRMAMFLMVPPTMMFSISAVAYAARGNKQ